MTMVMGKANPCVKRSNIILILYLFLERTRQALLLECQFGVQRFRDFQLTLAFRGFGPATRSKLIAVKVLSGGGSGAVSDVSKAFCSGRHILTQPYRLSVSDPYLVQGCPLNTH